MKKALEEEEAQVNRPVFHYPEWPGRSSRLRAYERIRIEAERNKHAQVSYFHRYALLFGSMHWVTECLHFFRYITDASYSIAKLIYPFRAGAFRAALEQGLPLLREPDKNVLKNNVEWILIAAFNLGHDMDNLKQDLTEFIRRAISAIQTDFIAKQERELATHEKTESIELLPWAHSTVARLSMLSGNEEASRRSMDKAVETARTLEVSVRYRSTALIQSIPWVLTQLEQSVPQRLGEIKTQLGDLEELRQADQDVIETWELNVSFLESYSDPAKLPALCATAISVIQKHKKEPVIINFLDADLALLIANIALAAGPESNEAQLLITELRSLTDRIGGRYEQTVNLALAFFDAMATNPTSLLTEMDKEDGPLAAIHLSIFPPYTRCLWRMTAAVAAEDSKRAFEETQKMLVGNPIHYQEAHVVHEVAATLMRFPLARTAFLKVFKGSLSDLNCAGWEDAALKRAIMVAARLGDPDVLDMFDRLEYQAPNFKHKALLEGPKGFRARMEKSLDEPQTAARKLKLDALEKAKQQFRR